MSKAEFFRRRHLELREKPKQEESLLMSCLLLGSVVVAAMLWVTALTMMMPE